MKLSLPCNEVLVGALALACAAAVFVAAILDAPQGSPATVASHSLRVLP